MLPTTGTNGSSACSPSLLSWPLFLYATLQLPLWPLKLIRLKLVDAALLAVFSSWLSLVVHGDSVTGAWSVLVTSWESQVPSTIPGALLPRMTLWNAVNTTSSLDRLSGSSSFYNSLEWQSLVSSSALLASVSPLCLERLLDKLWLLTECISKGFT